MKKVVRMLGLCALVALAFTSCKKNETNGNVTFKAIINQPTNNTRTHIESINSFGGKGLFWDANNQINVFNKVTDENQLFTVEASKIAGQEASFVGSADFLATITTAGDYIAFYPNATKNADDKVVMQIPDAQDFDFSWGSFDNDLYPMYGFNNDAAEIEFESHAGVLALQFKLNSNVYGANAEIPVTSIVVESSDSNEVLAGTMLYNLDGSYTMDPATINHIVTLNCIGTSVVSNRWTDFYIVLPENALTAAYTVTINSGNGTSITINARAHDDGGQKIEAETVVYMPQYEIRSGL